MSEQIILVDENDDEIGVEEKLVGHLAGKLHRGFSIFVFNTKGELMLQKRAKSKYHSGGLWTNTCCGHPRPGENVIAAAHRRLQEEMGFDCDLHEATSFIYKVPLDKGITEHEFLHVFVGTYDGDPLINKEEADAWKWITVPKLRDDIEKSPEKYTYWFKVALKKIASGIA